MTATSSSRTPWTSVPVEDDEEDDKGMKQHHPQEFHATATASRVSDSAGLRPPTETVVIPRFNAQQPQTNYEQLDDRERAVHRIRLSALEHNFQLVESAANRQRCSVITVVKADGCEYVCVYN